MFVGGFWRSRALLAVSWLGGLFYGGMSLLCRCLRALCVVSLVYFFYLSFYRCLAVVVFAFVVCGGFCANRFFLSLVCFFCANFSLLLMSVFIFFSRFVLRNMSFFAVDYAFLYFFDVFLYALRVPVFFSHCLLWVLVS